MFNKIKENVFFKSTIILLIGGLFGKIVGFILRIIITRSLGTQGMGLYSMLSPTSALLTTISVFSYSNAISKFISESSSNTKELFMSIIPFSIIFNIIIMIIFILFTPILSKNLLKQEILYYPIISLIILIPFMSISSIIKGYFWGKQNMYPYMLSNFIEQVVRLIIVLLFINKINDQIFKICFVILINIIGEISSWIVMLKYIPRNSFRNIKFRINFNEIKKTLRFCIPTTMSKIISSISYFLEPIILTNVLLYVGYSKDYIIYEYGIINAYSLSTLLMPQFFTQNMSTSLIPELSKQYKLNNIEMCKKRIKQIVLISSLIGTTSTLIITVFPHVFLKLLYNTTEGIDYIRLLSVFTVFFYIEYPLVNSMQALGKTSESFRITIITSIVRILSIIVFSLFKIGMYSLILSIIINLLLSTYLYYKELKKILI